MFKDACGKMTTSFFLFCRKNKVNREISIMTFFDRTRTGTVKSSLAHSSKDHGMDSGGHSFP